MSDPWDWGAPEPEIELLDLSDRAEPPPRVRGKRKQFVRGGRVVRRRPEDLRYLVVHQTACTFGKRRYQPRRHYRALDVACHELAFRDGVIVRAAPVDWWVFHGNEFNRHSVGLEIEGSYPGLMDDPETPRREDLATHWGDDARMTPVTDLVVATAQAALQDLVERCYDFGAGDLVLVAHRQSSATRRSDPGEELWQRVVLDYGVDVLGLKTDPDLVLDDGRALPEAWDPCGSARY